MRWKIVQPAVQSRVELAYIAAGHGDASAPVCDVEEAIIAWVVTIC